MVKSWTGWKRLSVNCNKRQDLPTPVVQNVSFFDHKEDDCFFDEQTLRQSKRLRNERPHSGPANLFLETPHNSVIPQSLSRT
jgi:hypothetical protein